MCKVFAAFDVDGNGSLEVKELLDFVQVRAGVVPAGAGPAGARPAGALTVPSGSVHCILSALIVLPRFASLGASKYCPHFNPGPNPN